MPVFIVFFCCKGTSFPLIIQISLLLFSQPRNFLTTGFRNLEREEGKRWGASPKFLDEPSETSFESMTLGKAQINLALLSFFYNIAIKMA